MNNSDLNPASAIPSLRRRVLGRSGLEVSEIGVGGWAIGGPDWNLGLEMGWGEIDDAEVLRAIDYAVECGANHFDTADVYGHGRSERLFGRALGARSRDSYTLASKVGYFAGTAEHPYHPRNIRNQLETSLTNLQTDYLDIYYMHNFAFGPDERYRDAAIAEFETLKREGKIRCIGMRGPHRHARDRVDPVPSGGANKYDVFREIADILQPDVIQLRFNILAASAGEERTDILRWAEARGVGVVINKPLAQGLLLGKYDPRNPPVFDEGDHRARKRWFRPEALAAIDRRIEKLRRRFGAAPTELARVALQYCLAVAPQACVVVGFRTRAQLVETLAATGRPLDAEDIAFVEDAMGGVTDEIGSYFTRPLAPVA